MRIDPLLSIMVSQKVALVVNQYPHCYSLLQQFRQIDLRFSFELMMMIISLMIEFEMIRICVASLERCVFQL